MLNLYTVWGPEYTYEEPVSYMLGGPRYETQDWINVMARNKNRAKAVAVKVWYRNHSMLEDGDRSGRKYIAYPGYWWGDVPRMNPFGMLTVEEVGPVIDWRRKMDNIIPDYISPSNLECYYE